jgi:hypothetical protein
MSLSKGLKISKKTYVNYYNIIENKEMAYFKINLIQFDHKLKHTCCEITTSVYVVCWKFSNDVTIFYDIYIWKSDNFILK